MIVDGIKCYSIFAEHETDKEHKRFLNLKRLRDGNREWCISIRSKVGSLEMLYPIGTYWIVWSL